MQHKLISLFQFDVKTRIWSLNISSFSLSTYIWLVLYLSETVQFGIKIDETDWMRLLDTQKSLISSENDETMIAKNNNKNLVKATIKCYCSSLMCESSNIIYLFPLQQNMGFVEIGWNTINYFPKDLSRRILDPDEFFPAFGKSSETSK